MRESHINPTYDCHLYASGSCHIDWAGFGQMAKYMIRLSYVASLLVAHWLERWCMCQPSGPGLIPCMSRSETAITRGCPILLLPPTRFSCTTCFFRLFSSIISLLCLFPFSNSTKLIILLKSFYCKSYFASLPFEGKEMDNLSIKL